MPLVERDARSAMGPQTRRMRIVRGQRRQGMLRVCTRGSTLVPPENTPESHRGPCGRFVERTFASTRPLNAPRTAAFTTGGHRRPLLTEDDEESEETAVDLGSPTPRRWTHIG